MAQFNRPQVLAHRMMVMGYPENTIIALKEAIKLGVDWIEFDVKQLKDGTLVSLHDGTVDRTTDGFGDITQMNLAEVRRLNAGKGYNYGFIQIPTVEEILQELAYNGKKLRAEMHIHNLYEPEPLIELLENYQVKDRCYFNADAFIVVDHIRNDLHDHDLLISLNINTETADLPEFCRKMNISYLCIPYKKITAEWVNRIHHYREENPLFIHCYPVQSEELWEQMISMGVDVIQTDYPEALQEYLKNKGFKF